MRNVAFNYDVVASIVTHLHAVDDLKNIILSLVMHLANICNYPACFTMDTDPKVPSLRGQIRFGW